MTDSDELITERVVATAKSIEDMDSVDELANGVLEVKVEASLDGTAREFTAVWAVGGPHIEVNLTHGRVDGWWGSGRHTAPVFENEDLCEQLAQRYRHSWKASVDTAYR